jgi:hypothetical protein
VSGALGSVSSPKTKKYGTVNVVTSSINMMIDKFGIHLQATVMDFLDTLNEPAK